MPVDEVNVGEVAVVKTTCKRRPKLMINGVVVVGVVVLRWVSRYAECGYLRPVHV